MLIIQEMRLAKRAAEGDRSGAGTFRTPHLELGLNEPGRTQKPGVGGQVAS